MASNRRYAPANVSSHVIIRGHNKMRVFGTDDECGVYLQLLRNAANRTGVALHAFVLMNTHAHLIVTPPADDAVAKMMQRTGTRYGRYFNKAHERVGAIWAGRYRAHIIDSDRYLLSCLRYLERNPVVAGVVSHPKEYRWSSYPAHALGLWPNWLRPHPVYLALGGNDVERQALYRALCDETVEAEELAWMAYVSSHDWQNRLAPGDSADMDNAKDEGLQNEPT